MNASATRASTGEGLSHWIAPDRTALLMIDMQVDFADPNGALGRWGVDLSSVPPALDAAERLARAARAGGAPVVFIGLQTSEASDSKAWGERMRRRGGDPDGESALCRAGQAGSDFYGPKPLAGDHIIHKARYSGFYETSLKETLQGLKLDTLVVCGLTTECCVDCTVRDAFHLDYHCFIAKDACAAYERDLHDGALKALELNCAIGVQTADIVQAWEAAHHG